MRPKAFVMSGSGPRRPSLLGVAGLGHLRLRRRKDRQVLL